VRNIRSRKASPACTRPREKSFLRFYIDFSFKLVPSPDALRNSVLIYPRTWSAVKNWKGIIMMSESSASAGRQLALWAAGSRTHVAFSQPGAPYAPFARCQRNLRFLFRDPRMSESWREVPAFYLALKSLESIIPKKEIQFFFFLKATAFFLSVCTLLSTLNRLYLRTLRDNAYFSQNAEQSFSVSRNRAWFRYRYQSCEWFDA